MPTLSVSLPFLPSKRPMRLTPAYVTQFVRFEQCERFIRFRLAERAGQKFMSDYDVNPQRITPLLSLSGHDFEEGIEKSLSKQFDTINYAEKSAAHDRPSNGSLPVSTPNVNPNLVRIYLDAQQACPLPSAVIINIERLRPRKSYPSQNLHISKWPKFVRMENVA
jgi:hypothetical protein